MLQYVHEIKFALETPMTERKNNGGTVLMSLFNMFKKKKPEVRQLYQVLLQLAHLL